MQRKTGYAAGIAMGLFFLSSAVAQVSTSYLYDANGRLIEVTRQGTEPPPPPPPPPPPDPPIFSISGSSGTEGQPLIFTVTRTGGLTTDATVTVASCGGTAEAADFTATDETAPFLGGGATVREVQVPTADDTIFEDDQTVRACITATTGNALLGSTEATAPILDNDPAPSFSLQSDVSAAEGQNLNFVIVKGGATELSHTVTILSADGGASSLGPANKGSDYADADGTVTFSPSQSSRPLAVPTFKEGWKEASQVMTLSLQSATNGGVLGSTTSALGTIDDADPGPVFSVSGGAADEGDPVTFTVSMTGNTELTHQVTYATVNGTAAAGTHFTSVQGTLTFTPGAAPRDVVVQTNGDSLSQNRTFQFALSSPSHGATASATNGTATGTVRNLPDNRAPVAVDDMYALAIGQSHTVDVRINDSDADGDPLYVTLLSQPSVATVSEGGGESLNLVTHTAGTGTFTYRIADGRGGSDQAIVTVVVDSLDPPPGGGILFDASENGEPMESGTLMECGDETC